MKKIIKNTAMIFLVGTAVYFCLVYPENIGDSVRNAVDRCLSVIIPSMFIFLCITSFITASGLHSLIGIPFRVISEKLFRIPKEGFAVFVLSMISGYPAGIKLVSESLDRGDITPAQARAMSCFCCSGGPAFMSGTAAVFLYPESNAGLLIFLAVTAGNIVTAFILTRRLPKTGKHISSKREISGDKFILSVKSASSAMLQMCIMIAAFGGICCILKLSGTVDILAGFTSSITGLPHNNTESIIMSFLEISNIITLPSMQPGLFPVITFLLSFGGVCVILQIAALAGRSFNMMEFTGARLFAAAVSAVMGRLLLPFLNIDTACTAGFQVVSQCRYSPLPSVLLIVMIVMLLGLFDKKKCKAG
ncbi:MAG: hypothetical protein ACI4JB_04300 [Porcipelethomonas sp.]